MYDHFQYIIIIGLQFSVLSKHYQTIVLRDTKTITPLS